jgi:hypothetical protein
LSSALYEYQRLETHLGNSGWPTCPNQVSELRVSTTIFFLYEAQAKVLDNNNNNNNNRAQASLLLLKRLESSIILIIKYEARASSLIIMRLEPSIILIIK